MRGNTEGRIVKGPTQSEEEGTLHRGREIHEVNHGHTGAQVGVRRYTLAKWIRGGGETARREVSNRTKIENIRRNRLD